MKTSSFVDRIEPLLRRLTGKSRVGPYDKTHRKLLLSGVQLRDAIRTENDPKIAGFLSFCMENAMQSRSQIFQDLFVAYVFGKKRNGFFCDFGATNGMDLSNSYYLEHELQWTGICAEPARGWHEDLRRNRARTSIETDCVWSVSGATMTFKESSERELSTLEGYVNSDRPKNARKRNIGQTYQVATISLSDMLAKHKAPNDLDYLSMDTEGSELEILQAFDFKNYLPKLITIEHNYTPKRAAIYELLTAQGYTRVLEACSLFDDWYLAPTVQLPA